MEAQVRDEVENMRGDEERMSDVVKEVFKIVKKLGVTLAAATATTRPWRWRWRSPPAGLCSLLGVGNRHLFQWTGGSVFFHLQ